MNITEENRANFSKLNVAVVGAGAAGLFAARSLDKMGFSVTIHERDQRLGGHAYTYPYEADNGREIPTDVGFIFLSSHYPYLIEQFNELGVKKRKTEVTFSVSSHNFDSTLKPLVGRENSYGLEYFTKPMRPYICNMITKFMWENAENLYEGETVEQLLDRRGYSQEFRELFIYPVASILWLIGPEDVNNMPASFLLPYFKDFGLKGIFNRPTWYTVEGGSVEYVKAIEKEFSGRVLRESEIAQLHRVDGEKVRLIDARNRSMEYDYVVMACPPDHTASIIKTPIEGEISALSAFTSTSGTIYLHGDTEIIPGKKTWTGGNTFYDGDKNMQTTFCMNKIVPELAGQKPFFVTLDGPRRPRDEFIKSEWNTAHPNFSPDAIQAQEDRLIPDLAERESNNVVYASGAYDWGYHDRAAQSGRDAAVAVARKASKRVTL